MNTNALVPGLTFRGPGRNHHRDGIMMVVVPGRLVGESDQPFSFSARR
jgi:hypothetical protein